MPEPDNHELLIRYARDHSEEAFATLVARHINLVYSAALRQVGNSHQAEEITQAVFLILAKKAGSLSPKVILSGWLYRTAQLTAANYLRTETRRQQRDKEAHMQSLMHESEPNAWTRIAPALDAAMKQLGEKEQNAVVLRFFEGRSFGEVGASMGTSEVAAKRRVTRALEKLRKFFTKRGIALSAMTIAGTLSANSVQAAPAGLAASITTAGITKSAAVGGSALALTKSTLKLMTWLKIKTVAVTGVAVILTAGATIVAVQKVEDAVAPKSIALEPPPVLDTGVLTASTPKLGSATRLAGKASNLVSILKEADSFQQMEDLTAYLRSLTPEEFPDVLHQVEKSTGKNRDQALALLMGRWAEIDSTGALAEISKTQNHLFKKVLLHDIFDALAAQDLPNALSQAKQLSNKEERDTAVEGIVEQAAQQDPTQALAVLQELKAHPNGIIFRDIYSTIFSQWAEKDLDQATQTALQLPNNYSERRQAIQGILRELVQKDPQSAVAWLNQLPPGQMQGVARTELVQSWSASDPQAVADYVSSLPETSGKNELVDMAAGRLAQNDPKAAIAWIEGLPASSSKNEARTVAMNTWAVNDPKAALDYVNALPQDTAEKNNLIQYALAGWVRIDPQATLTWISQLPDGSDKNNYYLLNEIALWGNNDPPAAAAYAQSQTNESARINSLGVVAADWANTDPTAAAQWLAKLPDDQAKNNAYGDFASTWARNDSIQAANWLTQLSTGPNRDMAIRSFSSVIAAVDPDKAVQWAESISDPKTQQAQVTDVLQKWMQTDPTNAAAAVQKSSLPDDVKNQLLQAKH